MFVAQKCLWAGGPARCHALGGVCHDVEERRGGTAGQSDAAAIDYAQGQQGDRGGYRRVAEGRGFRFSGAAVDEWLFRFVLCGFRDFVCLVPRVAGQDLDDHSRRRRLSAGRAICCCGTV